MAETEYLGPSAAFGEDREMLGYMYLNSARTIAETERQAGCELWPVGMPTARRQLRLHGQGLAELRRLRFRS